jgi:hypothetical protein
MRTTTQPSPQRPPGASGTNGVDHEHVPTVTPPRRRIRVPELAVGILITVTFALGAVLWHLSATSKVPALVISTDVQRGDLITASDVRTAYVSSDDLIVRITDPTTVVGSVATVDLAPGTLLTPTVLAPGAALDAGAGVVGLALDPGQYPVLGLVPGDRVSVVLSSDAAPSASGNDGVVARAATVFDVEDLASDRKLISIQATESEAESVAAAAGSGSLRLVLVAP